VGIGHFFSQKFSSRAFTLLSYIIGKRKTFYRHILYSLSYYIIFTSLLTVLVENKHTLKHATTRKIETKHKNAYLTSN